MHQPQKKQKNKKVSKTARGAEYRKLLENLPADSFGTSNPENRLTPSTIALA